MTTPEGPPRGPDGFLAGHQELDDRLADAFQRYDEAFHAPARVGTELATARMDLSLLLWDGQDAPAQVLEQLASDARELLRDTPPL